MCGSYCSPDDYDAGSVPLFYLLDEPQQDPGISEDLHICDTYSVAGFCSLWYIRMEGTPYSLGMMLWMIWSYDLYRELSDEKDHSVRTGVYVRFLIGAFLAAFLRNNGKYIVELSLIIWIIILIIGKVKKKLWIGMIVFAVAVFIIQGPLYDIIRVKIYFTDALLSAGDGDNNGDDNP